MTELHLFPIEEADTVPSPLSGLSADARRTARQHASVAAGIHPLTKTKARPDLGTCGSCALRSLEFGRFPKCTLGAQLKTHPYKAGPYMTHGAATDCRAWWPACDHHVSKDDES